jgi:Spy/CpxP family protein refolding chaperone
MQMKLLKFTALFLALATVSAVAQRRQPPDPATMVQHRVDFLTTKLGLTPDQQQQATTIFTNSMNGMKSMHDQMRSAHQVLQAAVSKGDNTAIDQAAGTIGNLTAQTISAHAKSDAQFMQILNADQQAKYSQIESHGPGHGFGPGFRRGGPPE